MPEIKKRETTEWIKAVAASYGKRLGEIAYIFCSDEKILEVNNFCITEKGNGFLEISDSDNDGTPVSLLIHLRSEAHSIRQ